MIANKKTPPTVKARLHIRNKHRQRYDFESLINCLPALSSFARPNKFGDMSIDFSDSEAVKMLNKALLKNYYDTDWDIPDGYLCPPIPGRADYLHYMFDLLKSTDANLTNKNINCLDIGVGANCIYPIIGVKEYGWHFVGSDIDAKAIDWAQKMVNAHPHLKNNIQLRLQSNSKDFFTGIINADERFEMTICNPPLHTSALTAQQATMQKVSNLTKSNNPKPERNFGGQNGELWCFGGEEKFIHDMIVQSKNYSNQCLWFSTLVAKSIHLKSIYDTLNKVGAIDVKTIAMGQGNKISRIVAWTFLNNVEKLKFISSDK